MKKSVLLILIMGIIFPLSASSVQTIESQKSVLPYLNPTLPIEQRVDDLISRMTLEEKVSQMMYTSKSVERLGIPEYNWWNECLHGVARSKEKVTVFPQPIGIAATFNHKDWYESAEMIADGEGCV